MPVVAQLKVPRANVYEMKLLQVYLPWFRGQLTINLFL